MRRTSTLLAVVGLVLVACGGSNDEQASPAIPASHEIWYIDLSTGGIGVVGDQGDPPERVAAPTEFTHLAAIDDGRAVVALVADPAQRIAVVIADGGLQGTGPTGEIECLSAPAGGERAVAVELDHGFEPLDPSAVAAAGGWQGSAWTIDFPDDEVRSTALAFDVRHYYCAVFGSAPSTFAHAVISDDVDHVSLVIEQAERTDMIEVPGCNLVPHQFAPNDRALLFSAACVNDDEGLYVAELDGDEISWQRVRAGRTAAASWSPSGSVVAFALADGAGGEAIGEPRIALLDLDSGAERTLTEGPSSWPIWVEAGTAEAAGRLGQPGS